MDKKYPELRPWNKLIGINGDLTDVIVAILSWISISTADKIIIRLSDFYLIEELQKEFPDLIQKLNAVTQYSQLGNFTYSKRLCDAIETSLQLGVQITSSLELYIPKETANLNLERLRKRVGDKFVADLQPVANRFIKLLKQR